MRLECRMRSRRHRAWPRQVWGEWGDFGGAWGVPYSQRAAGGGVRGFSVGLELGSLLGAGELGSPRQCPGAAAGDSPLALAARPWPRRTSQAPR